MVGCPSLATSLAQDALHLAAPALQPTGRVLEAVGGGHQSRYLEVRVRATSTSTPVTEMLLRRMEVRVVGVVGQALEQSTMEDKVARCLAELVVSSPPCLRVRVRRPEVAASLAVTLLGTNVQGSPLALHQDESPSSPARLVTTLTDVNNTTCEYASKTMLSVYSQFTVTDVSSP